MLFAFIHGFSSGLPLLLIGQTLQVWMREEGIDLKTLGLLSLVGLPYSFKFFIAPFLDRYHVHFLGARKFYIFLFQVLLGFSLITFSFVSFKGILVYILAFFIACLSASQDVVIDAYRRESLKDEEMGLGSSLYVNGYRVAMWVASGVALSIASFWSWPGVYRTFGVAFFLISFISLFAPKEEQLELHPQSLRDAVIMPLKDFFQKKTPWLLLAFMLLYKMGDSIASQMTMPFYIDLGYEKVQIAAVVKTFGMFATIGGGLLGGLLLLKISLKNALIFFGILQSLSTALFALLVYYPSSSIALAIVISFENLSAGLGTAAFTAFMALSTSKGFTATQFALLTSLMALPRSAGSALSGYMVGWLGGSWVTFFILCALIAIPGIFIIFKLNFETRS